MWMEGGGRVSSGKANFPTYMTIPLATGLYETVGNPSNRSENSSRCLVTHAVVSRTEHAVDDANTTITPIPRSLPRTYAPRFLHL